MYRTLLVPLDGSVFAEQALATAAAIAKRSGAVVKLVRVHVPLAYGDLAGVERWEKDQRRDEREYLSRTADRLAHRFDLTVSTALLEDPIIPAICQSAQESAADLVVISTHGRTGVSRAWLGSVADGVVRNATVPVLMVRPQSRGSDSRPTAEEEVRFERVLLPLDGSRLSEGILDSAFQLAATFGSALTLVRVVEPVHVYSSDYPLPYPIPLGLTDPEATDRLVKLGREYLTTAAARLREQYRLDVAIDLRVSDRVAPAILEAADERGADLVAMASHGRGASRLLVGSVADKVLRGAPRAVLLFRPNLD